jgi:hypothetical protein
MCTAGITSLPDLTALWLRLIEQLPKKVETSI